MTMTSIHYIQLSMIHMYLLINDLGLNELNEENKNSPFSIADETMEIL